MDTPETIDHYAGYRKALMDLHCALQAWEPHFRSDRKRNNVKNVVWLLECLLDSADIFAAYGSETPIYFRPAGKRLEYYIGDEWPVNQRRAGSSSTLTTKPPKGGVEGARCKSKSFQ